MAMVKKLFRKPARMKAGRALQMTQRRSKPSTSTMPLNPLLRLQQTIGNQAVGRLIQAKLKVGQPEDKYEREADRVAERVMRMPEPRTSPATTGLQSQINGLRGGGRRLPDTLRSFFGPRFGYDFSQVRIHSDAHAAESARSLNARAFTMGRDIVFGAGQYEPGTAMGNRLLAHELTHVIQQRAAHALDPAAAFSTEVASAPPPISPWTIGSFSM